MTAPIEGNDPDNKRSEEVNPQPTGIRPVTPNDDHKIDPEIENFENRFRDRMRTVVTSFLSGAAFGTGKELSELAQHFIEHMTQN